MNFDFEKFSEVAKTVFPKTEYSYEEAMSVFKCQFEEYEKHKGRAHPPIKASQIVKICQDMPYMDNVSHRNIADIEPEDYPALIEQHFKTRYSRCDYNINHFFSGRIREMMLYKLM